MFTIFFRYIGDFLTAVILCTPIYIIGRLFWLRKVPRPLVWKSEILNYGIFSYLTAVASVTVFPLWNFTMELSSNALAFILFTSLGESRHINLVPFATITQQASGNFYVNENEIMKYTFLNFIGKPLLFVPLGFLIPWLWKKFQSFKAFFLFGILAMVAVELWQYAIGRNADVDDVLLHFLGMCIGFFIYSIGKKISLKRHIPPVAT